MNKKDIFNAFEKLDPKFIEEAAPKENKGGRTSLTFRLIAIAATLALVLGAVITAVVLLKDGGDDGEVFAPIEQTEQDTDNPEDDIEKYRNSEYFEIIQKIHSDNKKRNNLPPEENVYGEPSLNVSVEITDNQTKGVEESDKIKRTDKYIFYMDGLMLRIFTIDGENSVQVGRYTIPNFESHYGSEIFLSDDAKTVTVISKIYGSESYRPNGFYGVSYTEVHSLDVTDPTSIKEKEKLRIKGRYVSARMSEGKLLVFVDYSLYDDQIDYDNPKSFLPVMDTGRGFELIPNCDIVCNPNDIFPDYMIALELDEKELKLKKSFALYGSDGEPYVSNDKIFFHGNGEMSGRTTTHTRIYCVDYTGESFKLLGSVKLVGHSINDKWCMDEFEGVLRTVVTTKKSANLYCVSLESFEVIASVMEFAPEGEKVQSVRFNGTTAYVCTAVNLQNEILDPVFFFDLSDLNNITYKETGTIEGMSTSLIDYGNGYLIGIGNGVSDEYDPTRCLKIEAYKETEDRVASVCEYTLIPTIFSSEYKAYYIDRTNQLLGFGHCDLYIEDDDLITKWRYTLLKFDSQTESFIELFTVDLGNFDSNNNRGVYIDGYMYMFGSGDFKVVAVDLENADSEQTIS